MWWNAREPPRFASAVWNDVEDYLAREVFPHVSDAHVADGGGKIGYEIHFTRLFYRYTPPRPSEEIKARCTSAHWTKTGITFA